MKMYYLMLAAMLTVGTAASTAMADEDGHAWMNSAPAFCRSQSYGNLTPKQMSMCDEAAFRYLSKHWTTITATNGQAFEIALDTITRPLPANSDGGATLRAASVVVYISEGDTFNPNNVLHYYFDCHDRFQTFSNGWSPVSYAPPLSIAAKISSVACSHAVLNSVKSAPRSAANEKSYDPIPSGWNIRIDLPGTLSVGAKYCTESGKCKVVGDDIVGFTVGGTPIGGVQGCSSHPPEFEPCQKAKIPVEVLAGASTGVVIIRLKGINYAVSAEGVGSWVKREPDGSYIGGPVSVNYQGASMPLQMYLKQNHLSP